jgi:DNA-binding NarL/FixJ family response regulator
VSETQIILIEDDETTRSTIKGALENRGLQILFDTANVADALNFAKKHRPEAAVIDYNLGSGPNGADLARGLRKIDPTIGIVLLTAFLNPTQMPSVMARLPEGSRYLIKHTVSKIDVLVEEISAALKSAPKKL